MNFYMPFSPKKSAQIFVRSMTKQKFIFTLDNLSFRNENFLYGIVNRLSGKDH